MCTEQHSAVSLHVRSCFGPATN